MPAARRSRAPERQRRQRGSGKLSRARGRSPTSQIEADIQRLDKARRVSPVPPGPASVTSRLSARSSCRRESPALASNQGGRRNRGAAQPAPPSWPQNRDRHDAAAQTGARRGAGPRGSPPREAAEGRPSPSPAGRSKRLQPPAASSRPDPLQRQGRRVPGEARPPPDRGAEGGRPAPLHEERGLPVEEAKMSLGHMRRAPTGPFGQATAAPRGWAGSAAASTSAPLPSDGGSRSRSTAPGRA